VLGEEVLGPLAGPLAEAATCTSAKVRDAARPVIARMDALPSSERASAQRTLGGG
jgi:hypothetical protein